MPVPAVKITPYIKLESPDQWVPATSFWKPAEPDLDLVIGIPYPESVLAFGWRLSADVTSGERFYVAVRGPLTANAADLYSVEEVNPGNRDLDFYLRDD